MACHGREIGPLGGYGAMLLDYNGGGFADLPLAMRRGQKKAQPGGAFGDGRIKDRLHVDAAGEQRLGEPARFYRAAGDYRHDCRPDRAADIEAAFPREIKEQLSALVEPPNP